MSRQQQAAERWTEGSAEVEALLGLARRAGSEETFGEQRSEQRFLAAFREQTAKRAYDAAPRRWSRFAYAAVAVVAVALLSLKLGVSSPEAPLSYRVSDHRVVGETTIAAAKGPVAVEFSDGTAVTVERGARARVVATTRRGAHFRLDDGRVAFEVVPHPERGDWIIDAGPFRVRVTGTAFTVEWNQVEGSFEVQVSRGRVIVEGAGQRRELGAGQSFRHQEPGAPRPTAAASSAPQAPGNDRVPDVAPLRAPRPSVPAESWSRLVANGQFEAVIAAAERRGLRGCLDACSRDDLKALADAARLAGRAPLAERVLLAQRGRFSGSAEARAAAFLLGRLAEPGAPARALEWYDAYLAESPRGSFAADALGRRMMLTPAGEPRRAALARLYLERFPSGAYARHARGIVQADETRR